jgi:hypothetical protein
MPGLQPAFGVEKGIREPLTDCRRSTGAAVAAVNVMSFRRVYWRLVWTLGAICIREWTNGVRQ